MVEDDCALNALGVCARQIHPTKENAINFITLRQEQKNIRTLSCFKIASMSSSVSVALLPALPALFLESSGGAQSFWEYFTAHIRNRNTRRAYFQAVCRFSDWCRGRGLELAGIGA